MKIFFLKQSKRKDVRKFQEIKQNRFSHGIYIPTGSPAGYPQSNPSISGISLKCPNFLRP